MPSLLLKGIGQLITLDGCSKAPVRGVDASTVLGVLDDAWVLIQDGLIADVGTGPPRASGTERVMDVDGRAVVPGFVDCHTHAVFAGWRVDEFELRLRGADYLEILRSGGGILSTVERTRNSTHEQLLAAGQQRLVEFARHGTTTLEIKSGYGLDVDTELLMLRVIAELGRASGLDTVATFLGAHAVPSEYRHDPDAFVELLVDETLPLVVAEDLAAFVDVFVEDGAFTPHQAGRILAAARELGLAGRLHADEMAGGGGAELGVAMGAASVDHLVHVSPQGIGALARSDTMAVLLPGTSFYLGLERHAPARQLWDAGAAVALASDFNPGSSPIQDMKLVMALACINMKLSPAEALVAATINPAHSLGLAHRVGSLEIGKQADLVVLDEPDWRHMVYRPGASLVNAVLKRGRVVA